jgi:hypothetical protein
LPKTDVAALFLDLHATEEEALAQLVRFYQEAAPRMKPATPSPEAPAAAGADEKRTEVCVLATPPGPAGDRLRALVQKALPDVGWLFVSSNDDIVFYREQASLPLDRLPHLGPRGQDAYRQMSAAENFTPHSRTDVSW